MGFFHCFCKILIKFFLHVFWILPIEKNKITLLNELSFSYGDSMKYLNLYINETRYGKYKVVFPIKGSQTIDFNDNEIIVRPMSFHYFKHILTSKAIITNAGGVSYLPIRKKQIVISTWHGGGPYKKTSTDVYNNIWYKIETAMNAKNINFILSSCEYFSKYEAKAMFFDDSKCIPAGMPRNDIFFRKEEGIQRKVIDYAKIDEGQRIVLYAPTYRVDLSDYTKEKEMYDIDIDYNNVLRALKEKFGGEWRFAIRLHPKLKDIVFEDKNIINFTEYSDMQELLYVADVVITDYSSLMWDYSFSYKPCFLYAPDIEEYEEKRGFYMPVKKWPFPLAHNNDEMIRNIALFDELLYRQHIRKHHEESGCYETGQACEIVFKIIEGSYCNEKDRI